MDPINFKILSFDGMHGIYTECWGRELYIDIVRISHSYFSHLYFAYNLKNWGEKYQFEPISSERQKIILTTLAQAEPRIKIDWTPDTPRNYEETMKIRLINEKDMIDEIIQENALLTAEKFKLICNDINIDSDQIASFCFDALLKQGNIKKSTRQRLIFSYHFWWLLPEDLDCKWTSQELTDYLQNCAQNAAKLKNAPPESISQECLALLIILNEDKK